MRLLQVIQPFLGQIMDNLQIQMLVLARIFFEIGLREFEQSGGGTQPIFLQMHKCACELNQPFVKISIRAVSVFEPDVFQNVVRLVKLLFVEQLKIAGVMRVEISGGKLFNHRGDAGALVTHGFSALKPMRRFGGSGGGCNNGSNFR